MHGLRTALLVLVTGIIFMLAVPTGVAVLLGDGRLFVGTGAQRVEKSTGDFDGKVQTPETIKVWVEEKQKVVEVDFETYVTRVVASEMPYHFDLEALKAQSVAARTFSMAKIEKYEEKKPESHPDAPVCNTTHCQVYKTEKALIACHEEGWADKGWKKIQKACKATAGQMLYYDGALVMQPLFFSSSGGQTENAEDVFVGAYPYLVSVASPYEEGASHANEKKTFSLAELKNKLTAAYPDKTFGTVKQENVKIISRTAGGRVNTMRVGEATLKGTEIRSGLGLSSALFTISFTGEKVTFTSDGYGHGVGMSQYGADGMAKEGYDYKEILTHYYSGTKIG